MRKVLSLFASVTLAISALLLSAAPAHAATGYVYLVTPKWWGWCPGSGNYVTHVDYVNGSFSSGGDGGDDVVYAHVQLGTPNTITMAVQCARSLPQGSQATITPARTGQSWFMGYPSGAWGN